MTASLKFAPFSLLVLLALPSSAWADAGAPMIFITLPAMLVGLVPIIVVESYILKRQLLLSSKEAVLSSIVANLNSTLIGVPLVWIVLVIIEISTGGGQAYGLETFSQKFLAVTWQAPWLIPYEEDFSWMIPTATLVLFFPFFLASWFIESFVVRRRNKSIDMSCIYKAVFHANFASYSLLSLIPIGLLLKLFILDAVSHS